MLATAGGDPTVAIHGWVATVLVLGGISTAAVAFVAFAAKILLPLASTVADMRRDYPVWVQIADKFGSAGGETISTELRALASNDAVASANQRAILAQLETVITQQKTLDIRVGELGEKLTQTRHNIIGSISELQLTEHGALTLVEAIVKTSQDLQAVRSELASMQQSSTTAEQETP